jgi:NTP-dependent ternary conflict system VMAP-like protein/trypsin-like peptidase
LQVANWQWRARIDTDDGAGHTLGAGFLIDQQRLLTCAHVVSDLATVRVTFPGGQSGLRASVLRLTDWAEADDPGDMALLWLDFPVSTMPARFASPTGAYWAGDLRAGGFRAGFDKTGSYITMRTSPDMQLSASGRGQGTEWWQVDVDQSRPERLADGFSGAAVYNVDTGEVLGMITDADLKRGGVMGRMLPLPVLRQHWEELDDLLWLPWIPQGYARELRAMIADAVVPVGEAYEEAFPGPPPDRELRSVWDAIRYTAEERFEEDRLPRFLAVLCRYLPRSVADQVRAWSRRALGLELPFVRERLGHGPASIIVRLERLTRGDKYELSFATLVDGVPRQPFPPVEVVADQVRAQVEKRMPELLPDVLGQDWMIEFALPEVWLNRAVEEWKAGARPLLAYPVVVRDVERLKPAFRQDRAIQRWAVLRQRDAMLAESVACANTRTQDQYFYWLTAREDICVLIHAEQPRRGHLAAALDAGIPVMVWPRSKCPDDVHSECEGVIFAAELVRRMSVALPDELPKLVRKLRAEARSQPIERPHCGHRLILFWDDPARFPDPPLATSK